MTRNLQSLTGKALALSLLIGAASLTALPTYAQAPQMPDAFLTGDDVDGVAGNFGSAYGANMDSWEDWLFVGAPREVTDRDGMDRFDGALYIYKRQSDGSYSLSQKLTMPGSSVTGDLFGSGVDAAAGWLFVGAANDADFPGLTDPGNADFNFAGQVHVFKLTGQQWQFQQTLTAPNPKSRGAFGSRTQSSTIALRDDGKIAVIGEQNNGIPQPGQLHTFKLGKKKSWNYIQTVDTPPPSQFRSFGDDIDFIGKKFFVAGGVRFTPPSGPNEQPLLNGFLSTFQVKGSSGQVFSSPNQEEQGETFGLNDCPIGDSVSFGSAGMDENGGTLVVSEPCAATAAGPFSGRISVYDIGNGSQPLTLETQIDGEMPFTFPGANVFTSRAAVSVSPDGDRFAISTPFANRSSSGAPDGGAVRVYERTSSGWEIEATLMSDTPAGPIARLFGETVLFTDNDTVVVRENNFRLPTLDTRKKGRVLIYDLD